MILSFVGICGCDFMVVKNALVPQDEPISLGFFNVAQYDAKNKQYGCLPYLEDERNQLASGGAFGAGRAFGVMTVMAVLSALFVIGAVMLFVKEYASRLWRVLQGIYVFAFFCQLFTFSVFAAEVCEYLAIENKQTECNAGASSAFACINILLLIALSFLSFLVPPPPNPMFRRWNDGDEEDKGRRRTTTIVPINNVSNIESDDDDYDEDEDEDDDDSLENGATVKITRKLGPHGTTITEEVTHADGSKTITETLEVDEEDYV
jgi:hypothetical protein